RLGDIVLGQWGEGEVMEIIPDSAAGEIARVHWSVPIEVGDAARSSPGARWVRTASLQLKQRA
ncbi:MAG: hypothetical protein WA209_01995, partial [Candidatus Acidiferrales bacterium]